MAPTITSVISQCTWNDTSLASVNKTVGDGLLIMFVQTGSAAPTIDGSAMDKLFDSYFVDVYTKEVTSGTYAIASSGNSRFYQLIHITESTIYVDGEYNYTITPPARSITVDYSGGEEVCIGFNYWQTGEDWSGSVTPPTEFTELVDVNSVGSGNDWRHGQEVCYRVSGSSPVSATFTVSHNLVSSCVNDGIILEFSSSDVLKVSTVERSSIGKVSNVAIGDIDKISGVH